MNSVYFTGMISECDFVTNPEGEIYAIGMFKDNYVKKDKSVQIARIKFVAYGDIAKTLFNLKKKNGLPFFASCVCSIQNYKVYNPRAKKPYILNKVKHPRVCLVIHKIKDMNDILTKLNYKAKESMIKEMEENIYDINKKYR